jgi:uncharacterized protein (TIGR02118 family)
LARSCIVGAGSGRAKDIRFDRGDALQHIPVACPSAPGSLRGLRLTILQEAGTTHALARSRLHHDKETHPMHCLTVVYQRPDDPEHFKKYYKETHIPLAKQLPGLKSCAYAYPAAIGPADNVPFCIFQAWFESPEAMGQAMQSDIGKKVGADVPNYSPKGATIFHFAQEK